MATTNVATMVDGNVKRRLRVRQYLGLENKDVTHHINRDPDSDENSSTDSVTTTASKALPDPELPVVYAAPTAAPTSKVADFEAFSVPAGGDGTNPVFISFAGPEAEDNEETLPASSQQIQTHVQTRNIPRIAGVLCSATLLFAGLIALAFLVRRRQSKEPKNTRSEKHDLPLHHLEGEDNTDNTDESCSSENSKTTSSREEECDVDTEAPAMDEFTTAEADQSIEMTVPLPEPTKSSTAKSGKKKSRNLSLASQMDGNGTSSSVVSSCSVDPKSTMSQHELHFFGDVGAAEKHISECASTDMNHVLLNNPLPRKYRGGDRDQDSVVSYDLQVMDGLNFIAPGEKEI